MEDMDPPDPSVQVVRSLLACAGCFVPSSAFATSTADWQPEPQPAGQGSAGATAPPGPRSGATAPATADLPLRRAPEARGGACTLATHLAAWQLSAASGVATASAALKLASCRPPGRPPGAALPGAPATTANPEDLSLRLERWRAWTFIYGFAG
ncbi:hypothetical protein EMIHUDRAFT_243965 [Emiliania huxleyi CCMP1516]|uniref:Uncharacterized protein n=2 Tax=Emiliania huxleyi TaxID=2903 RepID=A0A0D3J274_EMIH1|nr:hypothetical protein EMIHUDRAFT_243965 [Emiliania huxleyi CCMP1516]EOD17609.1 hypothetical protein EMIHUDRAFT_243965 [Emiliania huxleyi CCMP1516]|eukprot:XP_005770038.1 hypothetical protein EMIHUDRAFT_243965 [Emiliania huxleyi CCMP1516]